MEGKVVINYTKYQLKPDFEIKKLLEGIKSIQILICEKCYSEFTSDVESDCVKVRNILKSFGITFKCISIPFLCNNYLTSKIFDSLNTKIPIGVVACGIGVQFVAENYLENRVITFTDTIPQSGNATCIRGYHGISLEEEKCATCGQCYLELTGGICPVINCAKSLLNGPCGGADKEGMCEVDAKKRCVWIEIFERLQKQKRPLSKEVEINNYNIFPFEEEKKVTLINQSKREESFYGGVYPYNKKEVISSIPIESFHPIEKLFLFLSQHIGLPARPTVKEGDKVKKGEKIGESNGFISADIHSGVSGKVLSISEKRHPVSGKKEPVIIIENDGLETLDPSISPLERWETLETKVILEFLQGKGLVGMGGAVFPTIVKLNPPKKVDTLLINGCECEPYLSGDNRLMVEHTEGIVKGALIMQKLLGVSKVFFCIEEDKEDAIKFVKSCISSPIELLKLKTKYPQVAEKMLIKNVLGREVPQGGLPLDVGVVVFNVATSYSIYKSVYKGLPFIERVVTVAGEGVLNKGNYIVKIGTSFKDISERCFLSGDETKDFELKMGGPMMGITQKDFNSAVVKGTTGLLYIKRPYIEKSELRSCIKCGRCVEVCPMELPPHYFAYYGRKNLWDECVKYGVKDCIECGACQYICASKIDILGYIKKAKLNADN